MFVRARYATGNGALDVSFGLDGEGRTAPAGPLRLSGEARVRDDQYRGRVEGILLGGTVRAIGTVDPTHIDKADALIAVAIPPMRLAGHAWGPLRIDGDAHPGSAPLLDLSLALPGIVLTGKSGGTDDALTFDGRLMLADLALTARALRALGAGAVPELAGSGRIDLWFGGPFAGALPEAAAKWSGRLGATVDHLRVADNAIDGLKVAARAAQLSSAPGHAALTVDVASIQAGATRLRGLRLAASIDQQTLSGELSVAAPHAIGLALTGNLDPGGQGLALEHFALTYPGAAWTSEGIARVGFGGGRLSLAGFRLRAQDQTIAIDGAKFATRTGDQIDARVSLHELRLDRLPAFLFDPKLHLGGLLDVDVKADGAIDNPGVVASVRVSDARARGLSGINAEVKATLADRRIDGTMAVNAPFAALSGAFKLPAAVEAGGPPPGAPLDVRLDVSRLDLGAAMRGAATGAGGVAGRATLALRLTGSAGDPQVDLTATGSGLKVRRAATASGKAPTATATPTWGDGERGQDRGGSDRGRSGAGARARDLRAAKRPRRPGVPLDRRRHAACRRRGQPRSVVPAGHARSGGQEASGARQGRRARLRRRLAGAVQRPGRVAGRPGQRRRPAGGDGGRPALRRRRALEERRSWLRARRRPTPSSPRRAG